LGLEEKYPQLSWHVVRFGSNLGFAAATTLASASLGDSGWLSQTQTPIKYWGNEKVAQLVSAAPGGSGVREAIVTAITTTLGFDPGVSFGAVGLDRLGITIVIVISG
jgi:hypothetical protein